jgi:hypothetical protein
MIRLTLVIPGLLWPSSPPPHPAEGIPHAALARLLGRGQQCMEPAISFDHLLARLLKAERPHQSLPLATLRHFGEEEGHTQDDDPTHWLCTDPVNLSFMGSHVLLDEFNENENEISTAEATALIASLNEEFVSLGHFSMATPTRWYLRTKRPVKVRFFPLDEAVCRPMQNYLPTGEEGFDDAARHWRHVLNEIQVMLHNHPVNTAREAAGQRPINGVWFWGNGTQSLEPSDSPEPSGSSGFAVQASDPLARGLARAAGIEPGAPDVDRALCANTLAVLDTLAFSVRHLDSARWQDAFAALEQEWFVPIARAFNQGALRHFALHVPGERFSFSLALNSQARWHFWCKPLSLSGLSLT